MGIYLPRSEHTARPLQEAYFRAPRTHMIYSAYGARSESSISDGFCLNGFCVPLERMKGNASASKYSGGEDYAMHFALRHMIGHILITCWLRNQGDNRTMPRWAFVGAGQWLGKRMEKLSDNVYHCTGEDQRVSGSGKDWWVALRKRAEQRKLRPIGELIDKTSLGHLDYHDRRQSWGYFHLAMEEWRPAFVKLIAALREENDQRESSWSTWASLRSSSTSCSWNVCRRSAALRPARRGQGRSRRRARGGRAGSHARSASAGLADPHVRRTAGDGARARAARCDRSDAERSGP